MGSTCSCVKSSAGDVKSSVEAARMTAVLERIAIAMERQTDVAVRTAKQMDEMVQMITAMAAAQGIAQRHSAPGGGLGLHSS